ncbi:MAG: hypothetical protein IT436_00880 [Phycisphaerales bacterium]|nr:hypothetical protein [Phycisphaerales bacterium]
MNLRMHAWMVIAACGGAAGPRGVALASEPMLVEDEWIQARLLGHVYVNMATGERTVTPTGAGPRTQPIYWANDDVPGSCSFFYGLDRPTRDPTLGLVAFEAAVVGWGDVAAGSTVTGYDVAYATNIPRDTAGPGVAGLNMINTFIDDYDGSFNPGTPPTFRAFLIEDIQGGDGTLPGGGGWIYTIDLEGTGRSLRSAMPTLTGMGCTISATGTASSSTRAVRRGSLARTWPGRSASAGWGARRG